MVIKSNRWKKNIVAELLASIFLFPLVFNPVHYLFIEHHCANEESPTGIENLHKSCKLDDFHFSESLIFQPLEPLSVHLKLYELKGNEIVRIILSYLNFNFLLRAPPGNE